MNNSRPQRAPLWWTKVYRDLKSAAAAAKKSFITPGVVIGFNVDDNDQKIQYLIRMPNGGVGLYDKKALHGKDLPTGVRIKSSMSDPEMMVDEPDRDAFAFEVLREQIQLLPRMWLKRNITLLLNNSHVNRPNLSFSDWVLLSPSKRKDRYLTNLLESAVKYEGLKGLARFNDYASH